MFVFVNGESALAVAAWLKSDICFMFVWMFSWPGLPWRLAEI